MLAVAERITIADRSTATSQSIRVSDPVVRPGASRTAADRKKADAVLSYLRTVRALGRVRVSSSEISDALGLSIRDVRRIMHSLTREGVKPA